MHSFWKKIADIDDRKAIACGLTLMVITTGVKFFHHTVEITQKKYHKDEVSLTLAGDMLVRDLSTEKYRLVQQYLKNHPVYLSLSITPDRIHHVPSILNALDTHWVKEIIIALPEKFARTGQRYTIPEALIAIPKVRIHRTDQDYGPITKVLPTLKIARDRQEKAIIVVIDDDYIYPRGLVNEHIYAIASEHGQVAASTIIGELGDKANMPLSYKIDSGLLRENWPDGQPELLHGVGSIGFQSDHLDPEWLQALMSYEQSRGRNACTLSDDMMISYGLRKNGIRFTKLKTDYLSHKLLQPMQMTAEVQAIHNLRAEQTWWGWLDWSKKPNPVETRLEWCFAELAAWNKKKEGKEGKNAG